MKVLGIETTTNVCAAAIASDGEVLTERSLNVPHLHSEKLLVLIDESLTEAHIPLNAVDAIGISIGPGSFTGLRIGLSVAKGLAFGSGKPIVPVPTLMALAEETRRSGRLRIGGIVLSVIDARRDELYAGLFRWNGSAWDELKASSALTVAEAAQLISQYPRMIIMGDGAEKLQHYLASEGIPSGQLIVPPVAERQCTAGSVAFLAARLAKDNLFADIGTLEPLYVKEFYTVLKPSHSQETV